MCDICYSKDDVISINDTKEKEPDLGGQSTLLVCKAYFNYNVNLPTPGGHDKKKEQGNSKNKMKSEIAIVNGKRKAQAQGNQQAAIKSQE